MSPLLFALFLATFAIGTTEFAVVGLLPDIAAGLGATISQTGLLVSGYAIGVAIGGPVIIALTSSQPRKRTLLQLCAIFVVGHALAALAPDYGWLMSARVLRGCFARLLPRHRRDRGRGERSARAKRTRRFFRLAGLLRRKSCRRAERDRDRSRVRLARRLLDARGRWHNCRGGSSALDASVPSQ